jgi:hypothetical protein
VPTIILLLVFFFFFFNVVVFIIALTIILFCYISCVYHCSTSIMWGLKSIINFNCLCCINNTYHHFYVVILAHTITHMLQFLCMSFFLCFNFCVCHHSFCYISYTCHYSTSIVWHSCVPCPCWNHYDHYHIWPLDVMRWIWHFLFLWLIMLTNN